MELHDRPTPIQAEPDSGEPVRCGVSELAPADVYDPVVEAYKNGVDRSLLLENLRLTPRPTHRKIPGFHGVPRRLPPASPSRTRPRRAYPTNLCLLIEQIRDLGAKPGPARMESGGTTPPNAV